MNINDLEKIKKGAKWIGEKNHIFETETDTISYKIITKNDIVRGIEKKICPKTTGITEVIENEPLTLEEKIDNLEKKINLILQQTKT